MKQKKTCWTKDLNRLRMTAALFSLLAVELVYEDTRQSAWWYLMLVYSIWLMDILYGRRFGRTGCTILCLSLFFLLFLLFIQNPL